MWYEILINGYTWFINQNYYSSDIKLAEKPHGELTEGQYTRKEVKDIIAQINDYNTLGFNSRLKHLGHTGITQ